MGHKKGGMRLIFNNRKGIHLEFFTVFELVLAAIVIISLIMFVEDVVRQTIFEKNFLARDIAILVNTLYASPGAVAYDYGEEIDEFVLWFEDNRISVYGKKEKREDVSTFYLFADRKNMPFPPKTINERAEKTKIGFFKSEHDINADKIP